MREAARARLPPEALGLLPSWRPPDHGSGAGQGAAGHEAVGFTGVLTNSSLASAGDAERKGYAYCLMTRCYPGGEVAAWFQFVMVSVFARGSSCIRLIFIGLEVRIVFLR